MTNDTEREILILSAEALLEMLGLRMTAEFVPFSKSRHAGESTPSLNWKITIFRGDHPILTADFFMGCAHCPGYKQRETYDSKEVVKWECEHGRKGRLYGSIGVAAAGATAQSRAANKLEPPPGDVLAALVSDGTAVDFSSFEEWASDCGYEPDSRKAEAVYKACLDTGLKLRAAVGDDGWRDLREATGH